MPVDRVVEGILAALTVPESIGERIHLATDNRIRSEDIARITREEIGIDVRLADPTLFRNVTLPVVKAVLERSGEPKLANALDKLGTIFGGYGEWGQPIHDVGNDVQDPRPAAEAPEHGGRVPDALPAQQVRARSSARSATSTRSRAASTSGRRCSARSSTATGARPPRSRPTSSAASSPSAST